MSAESPDPSIDARLRQVPLPAGLLARLRQGTLPDEQLDETLRLVDLPSGLRDKLRGIPADVELDRRLRAVACPQSLRVRLKETVANEQLDDQLRDVPYPAWLAVSARAIWQVPRGNRYAQWGQALALMLLIGLTYSLGMAAMLHETFQASTQGSPLAAGERPLNFALEMAPVEPPLVAFESPRQPEAAQSETLSVSLAENALAAGEPLPTGISDQVLRNPAIMQFPNTLVIDFWQSDILGQPLYNDELPELVFVSEPVARGIEPPLIGGFDDEMLLIDGVQPIVTLNENAALNMSRPPLWTEADGYERARSEIMAGALPDPNSIHPEDFLAAADYDFPQPAAGQLALRTAAGPAVFGDGQSTMLLVGVQAGPAVTHRAESTHLVVAVDTSPSMAERDRLLLTQQALRQLLDYMRPGDRLSLVGFAEEVDILLESAAPSERQRILAAIDDLQIGQGTHVLAGLQKATSLAMATPPESKMTLEVVLITDGLGDLAEDMHTTTTNMMARAASGGVRWTVLDLGRSVHASENLESLVDAAGGRHLPTRTAEDVGLQLIETMSGGSSLVAEDARLSVEFHPGAVLRYRLVGHVPVAAGFRPAAPASLHGGQATVALYEVWLRPGSAPLVATATLSWNDAQSGAAQERKQDVSRLQVALTPETSAFPLVTAQVLAETAEILAQSPYVPAENRDFTALLQYSQSVDSRLRARDSYQRLLEMIRAAAVLRRGG